MGMVFRLVLRAVCLKTSGHDKTPCHNHSALRTAMAKIASPLTTRAAAISPLDAKTDWPREDQSVFASKANMHLT